MNLYVWEGILRNYRDGIAFAYANNPDEARALVVLDHYSGTNCTGDYKAYVDYCNKVGYWLTEDEVWELEMSPDAPEWVWSWHKLWLEIQSEPQVITYKFGRVIEGSE